MGDGADDAERIAFMSLSKEVNDRHPLADFYFYAKGWYRMSDDVWDDLRKIQARYCCIHENHITKDDIITVCSKVLSEEGRREFLRFIEYSTKFLPEASIGKLVITSAAIKYLNSVASTTQITDQGITLIEMGEPDYSILGKEEKP